jgi:hypothetical protein
VEVFGEDLNLFSQSATVQISEKRAENFLGDKSVQVVNGRGTAQFYFTSSGSKTLRFDLAGVTGSCELNIEKLVVKITSVSPFVRFI